MKEAALEVEPPPVQKEVREPRAPEALLPLRESVFHPVMMDGEPPEHQSASDELVSQ